MYTMYLFSISSARRSIYLTNPYFVPDETIRDALLSARARGVRVVLLLPGAIDHELVVAASSAGFGRLLDAGVEIFEYQAGLLHAKTMTIDGAWAMVGSAKHGQSLPGAQRRDQPDRLGPGDRGAPREGVRRRPHPRTPHRSSELARAQPVETLSRVPYGAGSKPALTGGAWMGHRLITSDRSLPGDRPRSSRGIASAGAGSSSPAPSESSGSAGSRSDMPSPWANSPPWPSRRSALRPP
jgi:PLD-like domain